MRRLNTLWDAHFIFTLVLKFLMSSILTTSDETMNECKNIFPWIIS